MIEWTGWIIYFGSFGLFFLIGFYIISHVLFEDHEIKSRPPLWIFSVIFSFAMVMLELVFFEILGIGTQEYYFQSAIIISLNLEYATSNGLSLSVP